MVMTWLWCSSRSRIAVATTGSPNTLPHSPTARLLVISTEPRSPRVSREVRFNDRLHAFAGYWRFHPRACAPYRARTKGKDERGVGYVKRNAIAGHDFASWAALEGHLDWWMREIADQRLHGTTGEVPLVRFQRDEAV